MAAHSDDCPFGIAGILLKAVAQDYRVVILNILTRGAEVAAEIDAVNAMFGVETITLEYQSGCFELCEETKRAVSEVVADVKPNIAFYLWPEDHHPDHVVAADVCRAALRLSGRILGRDDVRPVTHAFAYDNGPTHTIGFVPNTFVDITDHWDKVMEWNGRIGAAFQGEEYDPDAEYHNQPIKEILAAYRGLTCGKKYAEAVWSVGNRATEIF